MLCGLLPNLPSALSVRRIKLVPFIRGSVISLKLARCHYVRLRVNVNLSPPGEGVLSLVKVGAAGGDSTAVLIGAGAYSSWDVKCVNFALRAEAVVVSARSFRSVLTVYYEWLYLTGARVPGDRGGW